ncbi:DUF305 domain-containing protein [Brevundimonas sp.]|uniref:DUF305 domain-containing protein n=1 Tax=Brevundimonas sp. TaxID=1871086 RepID=UPI002AB841EF|nr:DUF305 domain-containing protein [Brevundimonas sp.]MDZ4362552.1 DUF305 domain-containing protein [Brevundimonas sp.]
MLLGGCEGGGDPVEQAVREASAARHAETVRDGEVSGPVAPATPRSSSDEAYIAQMTTHHETAIPRSRQILATSNDPEVRRLAQVTIEAATVQLNQMRAMQPAAAN